ncbi:hypothetical protein VD0004_g5239 [Verticillium dahliae]|uniref:glucan 1,3-beta-glucosidase n=1 Tax=Verticillium dahliae TaxID=27337 RepID=A0A444RU82_VERDA|nr:hypothetical protein VD0004_g5239 [Verticillium dahliae]PNH67679.1 hypothetical protein VD0001_g7740 [Verticillium dahliae]RXG44696.1 hypothetical protein VDGE_02469 [Verticillium dahliae]
MHLIIDCITFTALLSSLAAAAGTLGFDLGSKRADGSCKLQTDYEADMQAIKKESGSELVRIYAADQCNTAKEILPAAKSQGFQVVLGIWPDLEESYTVDKLAVLQHDTAYASQIYAVTVGSETLYRRNFTGPELAAKMNDFRVSAPGVRVGTADSWNKFQDGTADAVVNTADLVLVNAFSYWQKQAVDNATATLFDSIAQAYLHVEERARVSKMPELWVGETGWPSEGSSYGNAKPGKVQAEQYYQEAVCGMIGWGYNVFVFEAFDEPWKPNAVGEDGVEAPEGHWGVMTADRRAKFSLRCEEGS